MRLIILLVALILVVASHTSNAQTVGAVPEVATKLSWTYPTTRADTSLLPTTEIGGSKIYCGVDQLRLVGTVFYPVSEIDFSKLQWGSTANGYISCAVTVFNVYGAEGVYSDKVIVQKKDVAYYKLPAPAKATGLSVY